MYYLVFIYFILLHFILCIFIGPITQDQGPFFSKVLGPNPGPIPLVSAQKTAAICSGTTTPAEQAQSSLLLLWSRVRETHQPALGPFFSPARHAVHVWQNLSPHTMALHGFRTRHLSLPTNSSRRLLQPFFSHFWPASAPGFLSTSCPRQSLCRTVEYLTHPISSPAYTPKSRLHC